MNLTELVNRIWHRLDENALFYPAEEVVLNGVNPAMRLITYSRGGLLSRRLTLSVNAEASIFNLRSFAPRLWKLDRVVLGTMTGDDPVASQSRYTSLTPATIAHLAWKRDWLMRRGTPRHYWLWGDHWLGLYPRPDVQTTVTIIFQALPLAFTVNDLTAQPSPAPEIAPVHHPLIADVAFALMMVKEGTGEVEKVQAILQTLLSQEQLKGLRRLARQVQMAAPAAAG